MAIKPITALLVLYFSCVLYVPQAYAVEEAKTVVVVVDKTSAGLSYSVDSQNLKEPILNAFASLHEKYHSETILLVNSDLKIEDIFNTLAIMGKAELTPSRIFIFGKDKRFMTEIGLSKSYYYTTDMNSLKPGP